MLDRLARRAKMTGGEHEDVGQAATTTPGAIETS
jgi:hypothetical protein